jgi:hypothetical protein
MTRWHSCKMTPTGGLFGTLGDIERRTRPRAFGARRVPSSALPPHCGGPGRGANCHVPLKGARRHRTWGFPRNLTNRSDDSKPDQPRRRRGHAADPTTEYGRTERRGIHVNQPRPEKGPGQPQAEGECRCRTRRGRGLAAGRLADRSGGSGGRRHDPRLPRHHRLVPGPRRRSGLADDAAGEDRATSLNAGNLPLRPADRAARRCPRFPQPRATGTTPTPPRVWTAA